MAVDEEGVQGPESTITVRFDRTCRVMTESGILTLATQEDVDRLAVCTSLWNTRVDIVGGSTDPIVSLLPMRDITVSRGSGLKALLFCLLTSRCG